MSKVNYEVEVTLKGYVQLDIPEGLDLEEVGSYLSEKSDPDDVVEALLTGDFASETEKDIEVLQNSGYLEEAGFMDE